MQFVQARWYTPMNGRQISLAVIHRMEAPNKSTTAESVASYFKTTDKKVSAHRCYDSDSVVQCVVDKDIAYGAPGVNHNGLQLELAGYSAQDDWASSDSEAMLKLVASDVAAFGVQYNFPLIWRDAPALARGYLSGITSHWEVTKAGIGGNNHTDPGIYFPVGRFMEMIKSTLPYPNAPVSAVGKFLPTSDFALKEGQVLDPQAVMGVVTARECGIDADGVYKVTADGGVRSEGANGSQPPPFFGSYMSLDPGFRNVDRFFTAIAPNDIVPGYMVHAGNDHASYRFGPGLPPSGK